MLRAHDLAQPYHLIQDGFASRILHSSVTGRSMCRIAVGLVQAQAMLPEPAMQDIGIHAMFTGRGSDGCAGLQARGMRAVNPS